MSIVVSILIGIRTVKEEHTLADELEGYEEYCEKVHYRIIPYIF